MANHIWRAANGGVLVWEPVKKTPNTQTAEEQFRYARPQTSLEGYLQDFSSRNDCVEQEQSLPLVNDDFNSLLIKPEPSQDSLLLESSSSSPLFSRLQNSTPVITSCCSSSASSELVLEKNIYGQLKEFATMPVRDGSESSRVGSKSPYESNGTDVQSTPCPTRLPLKLANRNLSQSNKGNRGLKIGAKANMSQQVRRKLSFDMKSRSPHSTPELCQKDSRPVQSSGVSKMGAAGRPKTFSHPKKLSNLESLEALRNLERPPAHLWDEDERTLLTILYRWYDSPDPWIIPKVFNKITGSNVRLSTVRDQFKNHILLFGGRAYPEFARVMAVPFQDPDGKYADIHCIVEEAVTNLGIVLPRRAIEEVFVSGMARTAKSPRTRQAYKSLVRRAAEREREKARIAQIAGQFSQQSLILREHLGHKALVLTPEDEAEECVDVEDTGILLAPGQTSPEITKRTIAFRVWDSNSRTGFSDEAGFTSQAFSIWRGEYPPPFSLEGQGEQALTILTNLHLCLKGGASTFVSLSTSLLQALVKANSMEDPDIAVVALDHPLLTIPNKTLFAVDILRMLKAKGQAWWARYKGHAERMVWASVPACTILSRFPLRRLQHLADQDPFCAQILNLHEFRPERRTRAVSIAMREKNNAILPATARAMGAIARQFGMHRQKVQLGHVQGLVAALVDSFQLARDEGRDEDVAEAFAMELRSRRYGVREVAGAFEMGVGQGREIVAFYEGSRR